MSEIDLAFVDRTIETIGGGRQFVIPILQAIQEHYGYLPQEALERVCEKTEITAAQIAGVASFYSQFRHRPVGKHRISVCHGTACHVKGAPMITDALRRYLEIPDDDDTDPNGLFTIQKVACLGCCTLAPAMQIDGITYGHLTPDIIPHVLADFLESGREKGKRRPREWRAEKIDGEVRIGLGSCCIARGSGDIFEALQSALEETDMRIRVKRVGCVGMCHQTPLLEIVEANGRSFLYARVQPEDIEAILLRHFRPPTLGKKIKTAVSNLLDRILTDESWEPITRYSINVRETPVSSFLGRQVHIATENYGRIDPTDVDEYLASGGFKALEMSLNGSDPEGIIEEIKRSGLRGRGGAGFPSGRKWELVRGADGMVKYVICNGDEGDPGAFMDRMLLESFPYRVIEGMLIAGFAVGATKGIMYIRAEYPLALSRVREALARCEERGFLGRNILGSSFDFSIEIMEGAGAFVCGEETALLASIEGNRGMPRLRPPYPAEKGLWGKPTLVNNVETFSLVPWIIRNGADAFAALGTEKSKGTKVFALAGKVARGGLIEVPMGISIREIVEEIGGGIEHGRKFKAVQVGGPSGGCVPARLAHTPVDYEALTAVGAIMGSGGMVVLDEDDCMVEIARYFLEFTQDQSCGKCTYCRIGTRRMLDILTRICNGEGKKGDLDELHDLALLVKQGSLCGLGQTAPNPVLSTLKYYRDEYEAHLEGRCPAGKCKSLITYSINERCIGCTLCAQNCPSGAIEPRPYEQHVIDPEKCVRCNGCRDVCPVDAVEVR